MQDVRALEEKVIELEREIDRIEGFMTGNKYHRRAQRRLQKAARAAEKLAQEQAKKVMKMQQKGILWPSPNTIGTIMELQERSMEKVPRGETIKFVWCLVFDMPAKSHAKTNMHAATGGVDDDGDDDDGDGEDDQLGPEMDLVDADDSPETAKKSASTAELEISHEAWLACEKIVGADLVLRHVIPMDRRFLIISIGAPQSILVDEAYNMGLLMRLQESKGGIEFHPDLMRYFAAFHGGLNEYRNFIWKRRPGTDLALHFKDDAALTERQLEDRQKSLRQIFTSGLAQRCVWSRLNRKGRYSAESQLIIGAGKPKSLGSKSGPHVAALKNVQARVKKQRELAASTLHEMIVLFGGFRPHSAAVFKDGTGDPVVAKLGSAILQDGQFLLTKNGFQSGRNPGLGNVVTYDCIERVCNVLDEWRQPEVGPGREEVWVGTLNSYFPLHDYRELAFLRLEWGTPKCLLRPVLIGYDPEDEPKCYDKGPPKLVEHNTFGSAGNILHEHSWPSSIVYQPLEEIRDYFGDDVGLFFAWLGLYTKMLFLQSVFGCITLGCQLYYGGINRNPATFQYSIYVGLWSISFLETWNRRQNELQFLWSTSNLSSIEEPRATFVGELKTQAETGKQVLDHISPLRYSLKRGVGMAASFMFIIFTIASALAAQVVRYLAPDCYTDPESSGFTEDCTFFQARKFTLLSSVLNLVIIGIYGQLFEQFAMSCTNWENHRTQSEFDNALVAKNFLFQFVNNYFVLFYIAYLREIKDPISGAAHPCEGGNCLPDLQQQLLVVFTGKTMAKQTTQTVKPFIYKTVKKLRDNRHTKALTKAVAKGKLLMPEEMSRALKKVVQVAGGRADPIAQLKQLQKIRDPYELQNRLMPYAGTFNDFNDRVIQFGYIVLFAPAFPLAPFLAFINNVIEIRTAGFKMCHAFQRPIFKPRAGIGSWMAFLNVLGFFAVLTNASMITFVGSQDADTMGFETKNMTERGRYYQLWWRFVVVEHCVLSLRTVLMVVSPSMPAWIDDAKETLEYRKQNRYRTKADLEAEARIEEQYLKKMNDGFAVLAKTIRYKTMAEIRQLYDAVDEDGSGFIDGKELTKMFQNVGVYLSAADVKKMLDTLDESGDEQVRFDRLVDFLTAADIWSPDASPCASRILSTDSLQVRQKTDCCTPFKLPRRRHTVLHRCFARAEACLSAVYALVLTRIVVVAGAGARTGTGARAGIRARSRIRAGADTSTGTRTSTGQGIVYV